MPLTVDQQTSTNICTHLDTNTSKYYTTNSRDRRYLWVFLEKKNINKIKTTRSIKTGYLAIDSPPVQSDCRHHLGLPHWAGFLVTRMEEIGGQTQHFMLSRFFPMASSQCYKLYTTRNIKGLN